MVAFAFSSVFHGLPPFEKVLEGIPQGLPDHSTSTDYTSDLSEIEVDGKALVVSIPELIKLHVLLFDFLYLDR